MFSSWDARDVSGYLIPTPVAHHHNLVCVPCCRLSPHCAPAHPQVEHVVVVGSLPRTASNKIMRRVLRDQAMQRPRM